MADLAEQIAPAHTSRSTGASHESPSDVHASQAAAHRVSRGAIGKEFGADSPAAKKVRHLKSVSPHVEHDITSDHFDHDITAGRPKAELPDEVIAVPHATNEKKVIELAPVAAEGYEALLAHARAAGFEEPLFTLTSGFRGDEKQAAIFADAVKKHGSKEEARKFAAPPGNSKHRSGRAMDLWLGYNCVSENIEKIAATKAFAWMKENGPKFGFNPYDVEPWHWEYNATTENE